MHCNNCNKDMLIPKLKPKGPHIGAYCIFCGKYIKWLDKKEKRQYCDKDGKPRSAVTGMSFQTLVIDDITCEEEPDYEKIEKLFEKSKSKIQSRFDTNNDDEVPW